MTVHIRMRKPWLTCRTVSEQNTALKGSVVQVAIFVSLLLLGIAESLHRFDDGGGSEQSPAALKHVADTVGPTTSQQTASGERGRRLAQPMSSISRRLTRPEVPLPTSDCG